MGKQKKSKILSREETSRQMEDQQWQPNARLKRFFGPDTFVYSHPDGRFMLMVRGVGQLFDTLEAFQEVLMRREHSQALEENAEIVLRLGFPTNYLEQVENLRDMLAMKMEVERSVLESPDSLALVQAWLRKLDPIRRTELEVFQMVVAYLGELVRERTSSQWILMHHDNIWEPWLVDDQQRSFSPYLFLYRELLVGDDAPNLESIWVSANLRSVLPKSYANKVKRRN